MSSPFSSAGAVGAALRLSGSAALVSSVGLDLIYETLLRLPLRV
jgi:hypothetical protein